MEIFSLDLGNKNSKLKDSKSEYIIPSRFVNKADAPLQLGANKKNNVKEFKTMFDEDYYLWGEGINDLHLDNLIQDTLSNYGNRYNNDSFKLLVEFSLGLLASDFPSSKKSVLEVQSIVGVPTDDFTSQERLKTLSKDLKGRHQIEVDGETYSIDVKEVKILPQPVGTVCEEMLDDKGYVKNEHYETDKIGIVDIGGGTVLLDTLNNMDLNTVDRREYKTGINSLIKNIASNLDLDVDTNDYQLEKALIKGSETRDWSYSPNGKAESGNNITSSVNKQIDHFTKKLISDVQSTLDIDGLAELLITGGGANLINKDLITNKIPNAIFIKDSEVANVRGFYKYVKSQQVSKED